MIILILLAVAAIAAALFATQNLVVGSIVLANYHLQAPMYLIVLVSILLGLLLSAVLSFIGSMTSSFEIYGKNTKIKEGKKTVLDLTKQLHKMELENMELKTESNKMPDEKSL